MEAGERFHDALASVPRPAVLDRRTDRWAIADRVAWEELPLEPHVAVPSIRGLASLRRPVVAT